jgi:hypothetical protein
MNLEDVAKKIADGDITAPFCFHCKRTDQIVTSAYLPDQPTAKRLGQPDGKQRVIIYGVCENCMAEYGKTEIMEMMEKSVLQRHGIH